MTRNSSTTTIAIIVFSAYIFVHVIFDYGHVFFGHKREKDITEEFMIDVSTKKIRKISAPSKKKKPAKKTPNLGKMEQYHKKLIKPLTNEDKEIWIKKIWETNQLESHENREEVNILWWFTNTGKSGKKRESRNFDEFKDKCGPCNLVTSRSFEKTADAIVVSNTVMSHYTAPQVARRKFPDMTNRNLSQIWVFENKESGIKQEHEPRTINPEVDAAYNATMSYRTDSDITRHFGDAESVIAQLRFDGDGNLVSSNEDYAKNLMKRKFPYGSKFNTAWFVSNCDYTSGARKRFAFGKEMIEKGLKLYSEGECFGHKTERQFHRGGSAEFPLQRVKFYLAFENAYHCNDYISEKFWRNSLMNELVPVVFGPHPDDVRSVAPPNSYIHTEDFDSVEDLLEYMDYLDKNDTAYLEFHKWKNLYPPGKNAHNKCLQHLGTVNRTICLLCRLIRDRRAKKERVSYKSVMNYWKYDVHPECKEDVVFQDYQTRIRRNRLSWIDPF